MWKKDVSSFARSPDRPSKFTAINCLAISNMMCLSNRSKSSPNIYNHFVSNLPWSIWKLLLRFLFICASAVIVCLLCFVCMWVCLCILIWIKHFSKQIRSSLSDEPIICDLILTTHWAVANSIKLVNLWQFPSFLYHSDVMCVTFITNLPISGHAYPDFGVLFVFVLFLCNIIEYSLSIKI